MSDGFVTAALAIGLGAVRMSPVKRGIYPASGEALVAQATVEEVHHDDMEITDHPIEQGAAITDHAFKRPAEVNIRCYFSNSPSASTGLVGQAIGGLAAVGGSAARTLIGGFTTAQSLLGGQATTQAADLYKNFLALQEKRVLCDVYTGKRVYKNMLLKSLSVTTDAKSENALMVTATWRQVIIVNTTTVELPINTSAQAMPDKTTPTTDSGARQLEAVTFPVATPYTTIL